MRARTRFAHLLGIATLAVTVPVFVAVGPQYYVGRGAQAPDAVLVAALVAFGPALVLLAVEGLARVAGPRAVEGVHLLAMGLLGGVLASGLLLPARLAPVVHAPLAVAGAVAAVACYRASPAVRRALAVLAPASVLALGAYLAQPRMLQFLRGSAAAPAVAASPVTVERPTPVVLVVLDEMSGLSLMDRRGRLDWRRLPGFARLARHATWYPNATSGRSDTELAVPSVLTGRWAPAHALPVASKHPRSVFTLLAGSHLVHASEPWSKICPEHLCPEAAGRPRLRRAADVLHAMLLVLGHVTVPHADRAGIPRPRESGEPNRVQQVHGFAARLRPGARPGLHVLHVLLPHKPWRYLPSGAPYPNALARDRWVAGFSRWGEDPWPVAQAEQRYLLQVGHVDRLLGRLVDRLRRTGLYDDALVIVVADHGVSFRARDRRRDATPTNAQDILSVPLLVKLPGQRRGRVDRRLARTVDVVPTIAEVQGARADWRFDGGSLLRPVHRATVWIEDRQGRRVSWDAETFARRAAAALRERVDRFGDGRAPERLWSFGPHPELLGRRTAALAGAPLDATAQILSRHLLADFRPGAPGVVPARISGTVDGLRAGTPLAVAINCRIAATTRSYDGDRGVEFSAMIDPDRTLRAGSNRLAVLAIEGAGATLLRPLEVE